MGSHIVDNNIITEWVAIGILTLMSIGGILSIIWFCCCQNNTEELDI